MTRARDIANVISDANLGGTLDVSGAFTSLGIDDNADATAITIDSSEHVGIGTTSPDGTLHVHSATAGSVTPQTGADDLVVENSGNGGISILTPDANRSAIVFGHASDNLKMQIRHDGGTSLSQIISDDTLTFNVSGGTERMRIDTNGHITMPTQPAFSTYASVASNLSLNAAYTIAFDSPIYDNNSDFASNTFTAPVTGKYQLNLCVRLNQLDDATQYYMIQIATSNRTYQNIHGNSGYDADVNYMNVNFSVVADMDAGDTAIAKIDVPSLGTAQVDVDGQTIFSGYLVC